MHITQAQRDIIADQLSNNEVSDDKELSDFIVQETGLPLNIVETIVTAERPKYFTNPFYEIDWNNILT